MNYTFSTEIYTPIYGTPIGKNIWYFGDRNQNVLVRVGSEEEPITYSKAVKIAIEKLQAVNYPMYRTVYLHPINCVR